MSYINGRYISSSCGNCIFWSEHKKQGTCSQKVKTADGLFLNQVVFSDHVCSTHENDDNKTEFKLYVKKDNSIAITGVYNKEMLLKMKEYIEEKIKVTS